MNGCAANSSISAVTSGTWNFNADDMLSSETYDNNGNVLTTGGKSFTNDSENHMTSMTASGTAVSMTYDGFGNRVSKTVNGVTTKYLVEDDVNPTGYPQVFDELTNGAVTRTYAYGLQRIDEEQIINSTWTPSYFGYDGGGNVRQLTNSAGTITDTYEYDAYGNVLVTTGSTPNNYLYRGEQFDSDMGLYYLRARYYNPQTGRFMSRDPYDPELIDEYGNPTDPRYLHKYLYTNGDPVNMIDPAGLDSVEYALPLGIIAIPSTKVLLAVGGTLACLTLWEAGNVWANSVVASNGGYVLELPCFALPMSKKSGFVGHWYVWNQAKSIPGDPCDNLKDIMRRARKAGDSKLFNDAKATWKQFCR